MSSTVFQIASVVAGLAVLAADYAVFVLPLGKMKDLARGLAITVSLGLIVEMRRREITALPAGRHRLRPHLVAELDQLAAPPG